MPRFTIKAHMTVIAAVAVYMALLLSPARELVVISTGPLAGYWIGRRRDGQGISGSIIGGAVYTGVGCGVWLQLRDPLGPHALSGWIAVFLIGPLIGGFVGILVGMVADFFMSLLVASKRSKGSLKGLQSLVDADFPERASEGNGRGPAGTSHRGLHRPVEGAIRHRPRHRPAGVLRGRPWRHPWRSPASGP